MFALGAATKAVSDPSKDFELGRGLTETCRYSYIHTGSFLFFLFFFFFFFKKKNHFLKQLLIF